MNTKTDRELIELAAKAAGVEVEFDKDGDPHIDEPIGGFSGLWNPLKDDGDALRLSLNLGIKIWGDREAGIGGYRVCSVLMPISGEIQVRVDECIYAATRRAIVMAAAKIGEGMR